MRLPAVAITIAAAVAAVPALLQAQDKPSRGYAMMAPDDAAGASDAAGESPWPWPDFMGVTPQAGQYRTKLTLVSFAAPLLEGLGEGELDLEEVMRSGYPETREFCVAGDEGLQTDWLEQFDDDCGTPAITVDGQNFTLAAQCSQPDGAANQLDITGVVSDTGSVMDIAFSADSAVMGSISMRFRASTTRVGDCS